MTQTTSRSDRNDWMEFFATFIVGESFTADARNKASAVASAKRHGVRLKARKLPDGKYICTILESDHGRHLIMEKLSALPINKLKAIYKAANQLGIFK